MLGPSRLFDASAANYGEWPKDISKIANSCPTVASYGAKDRMLKESIERVAGLAYSEPEAEDAWWRILAFFGEHLKGAESAGS